MGTNAYKRAQLALNTEMFVNRARLVSHQALCDAVGDAGGGLYQINSRQWHLPLLLRFPENWCILSGMKGQVQFSPDMGRLIAHSELDECVQVPFVYQSALAAGVSWSEVAQKLYPLMWRSSSDELAEYLFGLGWRIEGLDPTLPLMTKVHFYDATDGTNTELFISWHPETAANGSADTVGLTPCAFSEEAVVKLSDLTYQRDCHEFA